MYPIRPTIGVEPTDPYEKAKQNIFTAANSVRALPPEQQEKLAKELFQTIDACHLWQGCGKDWRGGKVLEQCEENICQECFEGSCDEYPRWKDKLCKGSRREHSKILWFSGQSGKFVSVTFNLW